MICIRYWYFVQSLHECFIERCCKSNKLLQKEFQRIIYCLYDDLYEQGHHFSYSFEASRTFGQGPSDTRGKSVTGPPKILAATWAKHFSSNGILFLLKVSKYQKQFFLKLHGPKTNEILDKILPKNLKSGRIKNITAFYYVKYPLITNYGFLT